MMMNMFSGFDPSAPLLNLSMNWFSVILGLLIIPNMYWMVPSRQNILWRNLTIYIHKELSPLLINPTNNGLTLIFISLFSMILFNNFLGMFPYIFTCSSHMIMNMSLALPIWLVFLMYGWMYNPQHMFIHLVPLGTPPVLMSFMTCIETISNTIRPGTLTIRLTANMIAGHILISLLGSTGPSMNLFMISLLLFTQIFLFMLECGMTIIQSYVFTVLSALYSSEVN